MIFINGEKKTITEKDLKSLIDDFGGKLPKHVQFNTLDEPPFHWFDKETQKMRAPSWMTIHNRYRTKSEDEVVFCDTFRKKEQTGNHEYLTEKLDVRNGNPLFFKDKDYEELWFLYNHVNREGSPNYDGDPVFYIHNKKLNALKDNQTGRSLATAYRILYQDLADEPERIRDIARALGHGDVGKLDHEEVQSLIKKDIERETVTFGNKTMSGAEMFVYFSDGEHVVVPSKVREARDLGLIVYEASSRAWYWKIGEEKGEIICKVLPSENSEKALIEHFSVNNKDFDALNASVSASARPKGKSKKEKLETA